MTDVGVMQRNWGGKNDPDPVLLQIGALKINSKSLDIIDAMKIYVTPNNKQGGVYKINNYITNLTGITQKDINEQGISPKKALEKFKDFGIGCRYWSWGGDEKFIYQTCAINKIKLGIPPDNLGNMQDIFAKLGVSEKIIQSTNSGALAKKLCPDFKETSISEHDSLEDSKSIYLALKFIASDQKDLLQQLIAA